MTGLGLDSRNGADDRLLRPGWAGVLEPTELAAIKQALKRNGRSRSAWGFTRGNGRLSDDGIKAVAIHGDPSDRSHNARLIKGVRRTNHARVDSQAIPPRRLQSSLSGNRPSLAGKGINVG